MSTGIVTHRELDLLIGSRRRQRWQRSGRLPTGHVVTGHRERLTVFPEIVLALLVDRSPRIDDRILRVVRDCCSELERELGASPLIAASAGALRDQRGGWDYRRFARQLAETSDGALTEWRSRIDECWHGLNRDGIAVDCAAGVITAKRGDRYAWRARGRERELEEHPLSAALGPLRADNAATRLRVSVGPVTRTFLLASGGPAEPHPALMIAPERKDNPLAIFARAAHAAQRFLEARLDPSSGDAHAHLKRAYEYAEPAPSVDYEVHAGAFARSFFAINYWKAASVLMESRPPVAGIIDVGCGSGAAAAAALAWADHLSSERTQIRVIVIDRSTAQLDLAQGVLAAVSERLRHIAAAVRVMQADAQVPPADALDRPSLVLLSHLLTENREAAGDILRSWTTSSGEGSRILVIERDDDPAWRDISAALRGIAVPREEGAVEFARERLARYGAPRLRDADARPRARYADVRVPSPAARSSVERYFEAWRSRSIELLDLVFTEDATYSLRPFSDPLRGLEAIRAYWREKVLPQEHVVIAIPHIEYSTRGAFLEWETDFKQAGNAVTVRGAMRLGFTRDGGRIEWLREYYTKQVRAIAR